MTSEEAYRAICDVFMLDEEKSLVSQSFDPETFGNFVIEFTDQTEERLIVCDRGQIFASDDFEGIKNFRLAVPSLRDVTKLELLEAIQLDLPPDRGKP